MIHNNLRKLIRRYAFIGASSSDAYLITYDYTDCTGYTGSDPTNDSVVKTILCTTSGNLRALFQNGVVGTITISSAWNHRGNNYIVPQLGTTSILEPSYSLGTILSNNCSYNITYSYDAEPIITATVINTTNNDISFNEVGLFFHSSSSNDHSYYWNGKYDNYSQRNFLLIKEILPQSMTLEAQSSVSFSFNILGDVTT